jgi:hypothetical protein
MQTVAAANANLEKLNPSFIAVSSLKYPLLDFEVAMQGYDVCRALARTRRNSFGTWVHSASDSIGSPFGSTPVRAGGFLLQVRGKIYSHEANHCSAGANAGTASDEIRQTWIFMLRKRPGINDRLGCF